MDKTTPYVLTEEQPNYLPTYLMFFSAAVCFGISLFLPTFFLPTQDIHGYWVLFLGWLGIMFFQFAWYAAPLMVWAIHLSVKSPRFSFFVAILAIVVASHAFMFTEIPVKEARHQILGYGTGFYLWYSSFYIAVLGLLYKLIVRYGHEQYVHYMGKCLMDNKQRDKNKKHHQAGRYDGDEPFIPVQPKTGVAKKVVVSLPAQIRLN